MNKGDKNEGWQKTDGFWGKVALKCGHANTDYMHRALYMIWYKDTDNIKEKFAMSHLKVKRTWTGYG